LSILMALSVMLNAVLT